MKNIVLALLCIGFCSTQEVVASGASQDLKSARKFAGRVRVTHIPENRKDILQKKDMMNAFSRTLPTAIVIINNVAPEQQKRPRLSKQGKGRKPIQNVSNKQMHRNIASYSHSYR